MFELVFEVLGEFLIQTVLGGLVKLGFHTMAEPFRKAPNPWLAGVGYAIFGAVVGGISLPLFPMHFVRAGLRLANLLVTPIAAGLLMGAVDIWRHRREQQVLRIDRFAYGCIFALSFALIRFWFAK